MPIPYKKKKISFHSYYKFRKGLWLESKILLTWRYSQGTREHSSHDVEERAPSTAKEFKRVAEEKLRELKKGMANQTSEKVYDGAEEATIGDSNVDSIENRFKKQEEGADYRRRGENE
ncbi:hypothetical protein ACOSP7_030324 [Xanthoceras sorbifolium]